MTLGTLLAPVRFTRRKQDVLSGFMRRVAFTDLLVIIWAVLGAQLIRFGTDTADARLFSGSSNLPDLKYSGFSAALVVAWMLMLRLNGAYDRRLLGHGPEEYKAVALASMQLFTVVATASLKHQVRICSQPVFLCSRQRIPALVGRAVRT